MPARRDYDFIAKTLAMHVRALKRGDPPVEAAYDLTYRIADWFEGRSGGFNRQQFYLAAGMFEPLEKQDGPPA